MSYRLFVALSPKGGNRLFVYNACDVIADVTTEGPAEGGAPYSFFLYSRQLELLGHAQSGDDGVQRHGRTFTVRFPAPYAWLPGDYFFLLRTAEGRVVRFDLRLCPDGSFRVGKGRPCGPLSDEDVLSGSLAGEARLWMRLTQRPGTMQLKRWAIRRARENELNALRVGQGMEPLQLNGNLLVEARPGDIAGPAVVLLRHVAALEGQLKAGDCESFYDTTCAQPYERLTEFFSRPAGDDSCLFPPLPSPERCIYSFYNIGALTGNGGPTIMSRIRAHWPGGRSSAIFRGTRAELDALLETNPTLGAHFPTCNRLAFEPYTREEVIRTFLHEAELAHLQLSPEAAARACRLLGEAYDGGVADKWSWLDIRSCVEDRLLPLHTGSAIRAVRSTAEPDARFQVGAAQVEQCLAACQTDDLADALGELNRMVGLSGIKGSIVTLTHRMHFFAERRRLGLPVRDGATHHAIFTGNPGTGKTTVARLLGKVYRALGLLSRGEVVCVDRSRIIGRYIGETEENMAQILREARGNVLFVDEAYTLYNKDDSRDFGRHAVECLLDVLSRKNPDMLIIFAGYQREMDNLMQMNPGLVGRFPYKFHFPDYTGDELVEIARRILSADQYRLTDEAASFLSRSVCDTLMARPPHFANARWVEQYVRNGIIPAMADRVAALPGRPGREAYRTVELSDVETAYRMFNAQSVELKQRRTIGFCA